MTLFLRYKAQKHKCMSSFCPYKAMVTVKFHEKVRPHKLIKDSTYFDISQTAKTLQIIIMPVKRDKNVSNNNSTQN